MTKSTEGVDYLIAKFGIIIVSFVYVVVYGIDTL